MNKQVELLNNEGVQLFLKGRFKDAKVKYNKALSQLPNYATALNNLGMVCLQEKEYEKAKLYFKDAIKENISATYILNLGHAYANLGQVKEAEENYFKSIELNPNSIMAWKSIAALYQFQKLFYKSSEIWEHILNKLSHDNYFRIQLVKDFIKLKEYRNALTVLHEASISDKHKELIWYYTALIHFNNKNFGLAEVAIKKSLAILPDNESFRRLGASIYLGLNDLEEALKQWDFLLNIDRNNHLARVDKAVALLAYHRENMALKEFNLVISLDNNNYKAHYYKALVLIELGKKNEALQILTFLINLENEYKDCAVELIKKLTS